MKIKTAMTLMFVGGACAGIAATMTYFKNKYEKIAYEQIDETVKLYNQFKEDFIKEHTPSEEVDEETKEYYTKLKEVIEKNEKELDMTAKEIKDFYARLEEAVAKDEEAKFHMAGGDHDMSVYNTMTDDSNLDIPASKEPYVGKKSTLEEDIEKGIVKVEDAKVDPDYIYLIGDEEFGMCDYDEDYLIYFDDHFVSDRNGNLVDIDELVGWEWMEVFDDIYNEEDYVYVRNDKLKTDFEIVLCEARYVDKFPNGEMSGGMNYDD